jgi:hypothetical protein
MAEAFVVLANQGIRKPLVAITVTDWKDNVLEEVDIKD